MFTRAVLVVALVALSIVAPGRAQERFSFFQASSPESVERMLTLAGLRDDDVVVDLGAGDGLIPLTAARMNARLRGWGVDIDPDLVRRANERARSHGVADRVRFEHRNAFDADLRDATVVTMWVFPELMRLLRPVILQRARPGTRVLTSTWDLGSWKPDAVSPGSPPVYMWIVPARVAGGWEWELEVGGRRIEYAAFFDQHFQMLEGVARAGDRREVLESTLRGAGITFTLEITLDGLGLTQHEFRGEVDRDQIVGTVTLIRADADRVTLPFRARRAAPSRYFAPTGTPAIDPFPGPLSAGAP